MTKGFVNSKYRTLLGANTLGWVVALIGSLADSVIGGLLISEDAVSATGLVQPVFSFIFFICLLIAIGTANKFSIYAGAFDTDKAYKVAGLGVMAAVVVGLILAALLYFGEDFYFTFYSSSPEIDLLAREYYRPYIFVALLYPIYWTLYYMVTADGNAALILISDIVMAVTNSVFSLVLVGFWGVKGLAYGTVFSLLICIALILLHFLSKKCSIRFKLSCDFKLFSEIAAAGSTSSLTTLYVAIIDVIMNKFVIVNFGDKYLAAYAVVNLLLNLAEVTMCSCDAAGPFIGVSYGEGNTKELKRILKMCTRDTLIISGFFSIVLFLCAKFAPAIYGITTPEIFDVSVTSARVLALSYIATGMVYLYTDYMPRVDKSIIGNLMGALYMLVTPLAFAIPMGKFWGYNGMLWGFFLTPFVSLLVGILIIRAKYGKEAFPFAIVDSKDDIFIHEFAINDEEIVMLNAAVKENLESINVEASLITKVQLMIEETFEIVKSENPDKKRILAECTLMVNDKYLRLITRDSGRVFDITKSDEDIKSLGHYVAARMMETANETTYQTSISFNRNSYMWER